MSSWRAAGGLLVVAGVLLLAGCRSTQPIGRLLDDPFRYDGRTVAVEGEVVRSAGVLGYGAYEIRGGTGTLVVVSEDGGAPRQGARVKVRGRFQALLTYGPRSFAALLEGGRDRP